jgi:hypothetical protein
VAETAAVTSEFRRSGDSEVVRRWARSEGTELSSVRKKTCGGEEVRQ